MVIIAGHIDVSVGSLIGVLATISGTLAVRGYPIWVAWLASIVAGIAIQAVNGVLVAYARIPAIVVTLGMLSILKGGLISSTRAPGSPTFPRASSSPNSASSGFLPRSGSPSSSTVLAALWMRYSALGRSIYAVGGNPDAARAAGIQTRPTVVFVFALHGFFAGIAAILFASQLQVIQSTVPPNLELNVITASVIGGVSILGGPARSSARRSPRSSSPPSAPRSSS